MPVTTILFTRIADIYSAVTFVRYCSKHLTSVNSVPTVTLRGGCCYHLYFTYDKTEAKRGERTCRWVQSWDCNTLTQILVHLMFSEFYEASISLFTIL